MIPNLTEIAKQLVTERDALRSSSPSDPHIQELNAQIHYNIKNGRIKRSLLTATECLAALITQNYDIDLNIIIL